MNVRLRGLDGFAIGIAAVLLAVALRCEADAPVRGIVTSVSSFVGQTLRSTNLQVGHESWTFKDGAPPDVTCLAQTNDGFLWLCASNGLLRFDGTRFEPFRSPFGDRLLSTNVYSLFVPPSGGLWVGTC